ncbi:MAG: N-acetylmuramoyl-L-alanine amidase, partial [Rhodanobacter sp.]
MSGYLNKWVGGFVVAIATLIPVWAVNAAELKDARVWAGPEYTRVVLDASGPLQYTISQRNGRVVVELPGSSPSRDFSDPAAQGLLRGLTHSRLGSGMQVTAEVDPASRLKSFMLKPGDDGNYRLVLDFYPAGHATEVDSDVAAAVEHAASVVAKAPVAAPVIKQSAPGESYSNPTRSRRVAAEQAAAMLNGQRQVVVAIDAGHGGKDPGSHGPAGTLEKNVTLAVARALAAEINRQPGMKAVLTRDSDYFIPLAQRYKIARENNADLFVSIHADAFTSGDARGSSVWVLSPRGKTSEAARWLADRENRADL